MFKFSEAEADAFLMYLYGAINDEFMIQGPWLGVLSSTIVLLHTNDVALNWARDCDLELNVSVVLY